MMKKLLFMLFVLPLCAVAQTVEEPACDTGAEGAVDSCKLMRLNVASQFGVIDYDGVLEMMPEWKEAQKRLAELKAKYDAESERAEAEFQRKFAEFLEGQKDFPQNIMEKRQKELQMLLEQSVQFRQSVQKLLKQAEADFTANARRKLDATLREVAKANGMLFIFNSANNQIPFVDSDKVVDVEQVVLDVLGL